MFAHIIKLIRLILYRKYLTFIVSISNNNNVTDYDSVLYNLYHSLVAFIIYNVTIMIKDHIMIIPIIRIVIIFDGILIDCPKDL